MWRAETNSCKWDQPVPFSRNLRNFIAKSRKGQTLYSNCEGAYLRRVFKIEEENSLKDYIYYTVYYKGDSNFREGDENSEKVDSILRKIAALSNKFGFRGETHLTVVWMYLFDFESCRELSFPVFKIYKAKTQEDAVFLTLDLTLHDCWDSYLESGSFPDAFVCVPRHGQYHFDEEENKLDLEFLTRRSKVSQAFSFTFWNSRTFWDMTFSPFCHTVVHPLIIKMKEFSDAVMAEIKVILMGFQDFWSKYGDGILRGVIFAILVLIKPLSQNCSMILTKSDHLKSFKKISVAGLMLLNTSDSKTEKFLNLIGSLINDSPSLTANTEKILSAKAEMAELISLWTEPKKNWREILKIFCSLFINARPLLMTAITNFNPNLNVLILLTMLFNLAEKLQTSAFLNSSEKPLECQVYRSHHKSATAFCNSQSSGKNNAIISKSVDAVGKPLRLNNSGAEAFEYEKKGQPISVEKLLEDFDDLEMVSARVIEKRAQSTNTTSLPCPANSHLAKDVDGQRIFFMYNPSTPRLASYIRYLLGIDISLTPENDFMFSVKAPSGEIVGNLYFPLDFFGIALFPIKNLARKKQESKKER